MSPDAAMDLEKKQTAGPLPAQSLPQPRGFELPRSPEPGPLAAPAGHQFGGLPVNAPPVIGSCPMSLASPRACPFGGACHTCPARVQAKLAVDRPGDMYEQEADRMAEAVTGGGRLENSAPLRASSNPLSGEVIHRAPLPGDDETAQMPASAGDTEEEFDVGNTMDDISVETPAESVAEFLGESSDVAKGPGKKMGGPLGEVREGMGKGAGATPPGCASWVKLTRTTYPSDPGKGADALEKTFVTKYKDFKEGVAVAKPGDFNAKLKSATSNPCTCLSKLNIDGHGASWSGGGQEFAPRKHALGARSFGVKKNAKGNLVPYNFDIFNGIAFCKPCVIVLGGCYVGLNTPHKEAGAGGFKGAGDALGNALAAKTGCSVRAYTGTTTTPKPGEFKGDKPGEWREWKPKEVKP